MHAARLTLTPMLSTACAAFAAQPVDYRHVYRIRMNVAGVHPAASRR